MPLLEIENLSISFQTRGLTIPAVTDFSLTIMPGEAMGLVGESGCGKSTVALGIMQDLGPAGRVTAGRVRFDARDLAALSPRDLRAIRGREIAMVYQEPMASLNPAMRVGAQLAEVPMTHEGTSRREALARARAMLADVHLPDPDRILRAYPHELSGGQQQRIVIAMALMSNPSLLILDEPTTALDVTVEAGIVDLLRELRRKHGTAMLFISHNLGLIRDTCDRLCVMYAGEAVETGTVAEVFTAMRHPYTQGLFRAIPRLAARRATEALVPIPGNAPLPQERPPGCNFGPRCPHVVPRRCDAQKIPMLPVAPPHASRCIRWDEIDWSARPPAGEIQPHAPSGETILRIEDLRKYYETGSGLFGPRAGAIVKANESLTFTVRQGETLAIVGESGCGKSTLAKLLVGLETATSGRILLDGHEVQHLPVEARPRAVVADLQMIFQNPADTLNPAISVGRQITRALEVFRQGASDADRRARTLDLLDLVQLPRAFAARLPRQLSGGQKQRVGIARAFASGARIVVADEPVSALDVSVQAAVTKLLTDMQRETGTTLIFISHDLALVRHLADRVMVMYLGHIVEIGPAEAVFSPPFHPYTEALLSAVPLPDPGAGQRRIVLEGDIPSATHPPPGCPFHTRCHRKAQVPGTLCETVLPPMQRFENGHAICCHLDRGILEGMAPVIAEPSSGQ
ncbi:dipeptide ABC transporter ATP-binding protein [Paracoccus sp. S-4012]|uniref:dipeptide ABC transporter ATP-binding protein n=1 Tax=Paracoccus sp. S-4012 TaxID=2665648 RepID=UPI0012B0E86C|nr:ABC transporter ATP-binding protein [Paracoccus sp. S-4012]MRX50675.1 dipeptide ABC transporter ATP-binding protein [Paracoccus sp. S-4012]